MGFQKTKKQINKPQFNLITYTSQKNLIKKIVITGAKTILSMRY